MYLVNISLQYPLKKIYCPHKGINYLLQIIHFQKSSVLPPSPGAVFSIDEAVGE